MHATLKHYVRVRDMYQRRSESQQGVRNALQAEFEATVIARFCAKHKKRKAAYSTARKDTALYDLVFAEFVARADKISVTHRAQRARLDALIKAATLVAVVKPSDSHRSRYSTHSSGTYNSQGFGARSYAHGAAKMDVAGLTAQGFKAEIVTTNEQTYPGTRLNGGWTMHHVDYEVWINADEVTAEVLHEKPALPLDEVVAACWRNGVNPRVYMPMLPHGFEEKHGITNFGQRYKVGQSA